jgi:hypothetical protein
LIKNDNSYRNKEKEILFVGSFMGLGQIFIIDVVILKGVIGMVQLIVIKNAVNNGKITMKK